MGLRDWLGRLTGGGRRHGDDLLPVLRTYEPGDVFAEAAVHRAVGPNLANFLARVNWTPRRTIRIDYLMKHEVASSGGPEDPWFEAAYANLRRGLKVEGGETEGGKVFFFTHPLDHGASALALPDFYQKAAAVAGTPDLVVGFPDPSTLFVAPAGNADAIEKLRELVVTSGYWGSVSLTPACYHLDADGLRLIARRPDPNAEG